MYSGLIENSKTHGIINTLIGVTSAHISISSTNMSTKSQATSFFGIINSPNLSFLVDKQDSEFDSGSVIGLPRQKQFKLSSSILSKNKNDNDNFKLWGGKGRGEGETFR